jgi:D-beta-D-heptose 7-phosphate kinase/D-beta-D-heptose 1-phosphate adenosyltransferase
MWPSVVGSLYFTLQRGEVNGWTVIARSIVLTRRRGNPALWAVPSGARDLMMQNRYDHGILDASALGQRRAAVRKVYALRDLVKIRRRLKREGKTVVFTNGCFDLLHAGHVRLFQRAKRLGDVLIVALNTDGSIRKLKGPSRPIFPLRERFEILEAVEVIDYLTSFAEETPQKIIAALLPDVLVKGGDWRPHEVVGKREVEAAGGRVAIIPYLKGHSSSAILQQISRYRSP